MTPEVSTAAVTRALEGHRIPEIPPERRDPTHFREPWVWPQVS